MRLLFAGTPEPAVTVLEAIHASDHEIVAVLTRADARQGRGRTLHPSPVSAWAQHNGIPVLTPKTLREAAVQQQIADLAVDAAPVVAYGNLVPPALLSTPRHGWLNLHFSLLPAWRGAAPVQRAIMAGDQITGTSIFRLEEGLDTGPVYATTTRPITERDTAGDLLAALASDGSALMVQVLDQLAADSIQPTPQSEQEVSHAPKLSTADARVRFDRSAQEIDRLIRGTTPAPGAWTSDARGQRLKLGPVTLLPQADQPAELLAAGQVLTERRRVLVGTGTDPIALGEVAPAGKSWMTATDWARGARLDAGARLGEGENR